jgi:hypothetical protein
VNLSTLLVLVFLVGMWAALLVGPVLQHRGSGGNRGGRSVQSFQRQLSVLDRNRTSRSGLIRPVPTLSARGVVHPPLGRVSARSRSRLAAQRRRRIISVLAGLSGTFLLLSFLRGGVFVVLLGVSAVLLVGYLALMFHLLGTQAEREMKVAFLPHRTSGTGSTDLLHLREVSGRR